jgi:hypothetical protein
MRNFRSPRRRRTSAKVRLERARIDCLFVTLDKAEGYHEPSHTTTTRQPKRFH